MTETDAIVSAQDQNGGVSAKWSFVLKKKYRMPREWLDQKYCDRVFFSDIFILE
jgi:hypothetical protein